MRQIITKSSLGFDSILTVPTQPRALEIIYKTASPGGPFGYFGPDVCADQSVAVRFKPDTNSNLEKIGLWFMNNGKPNVPEVRVTLRDDNSNGKVSVPGDTILESWAFDVSAVGWKPVFEELDSKLTPFLEAKTKYWVATESDDKCGDDGVWVMASGRGFSTNSIDGDWQPGSNGGVPATVVLGITR
jgi:hypothetical protein